MTKFNTNTQNPSAVAALELQLTELLKQAGATSIGRLEDDGEGMCTSLLPFRIKGVMYALGITNDAQELMLQNIDGTPNVKTVGLESWTDGNIAVCETPEEILKELASL